MINIQKFRLFESTLTKDAKRDIIMEVVCYVCYCSKMIGVGFDSTINTDTQKILNQISKVLDEKKEDNIVLYEFNFENDVNTWVDDYMKFVDDEEWFSKVVELYNIVRRGNKFPSISELEDVFLSYKEGNGFKLNFEEDGGIANDKYTIRLQTNKCNLKDYVTTLSTIENTIKNRLGLNVAIDRSIYDPNWAEIKIILSL